MNQATYFSTTEMLFLRRTSGDWVVGRGPFFRSALPVANRAYFYLPDFFLADKEPYWHPQIMLSLSHQEFIGQAKAELERLKNLAVLKEMESVFSRPAQLPDKELFKIDYQRVQGEIARKTISKAVPFVMAGFAGVPSLIERLQMLLRLAELPAKFCVYGGWWGNEGLLGATPEILFSLEENWLETMALAGTTSNPGPSLLADAKQVFEHQVVVGDIQRQLARFGQVRTTPTRDWELGRLKHLRTDLAIEASVDFPQAVEALHPTPALGVAPRTAGFDILRASALASERRRFGAPFGFHKLADEREKACSTAVVAIRGIQWHENKTWQAAGCGVVAHSEFNAEWSELELKLRVVREQLGGGLNQ